MDIDEVITKLRSPIENANLPAFCETYLLAGWEGSSLMIAAAAVIAFPRHKQRAVEYAKLAETLRRAVDAYRPGTLNENPFTIMKNLELAVVNDDQAMYDEARAKDTDGRIAGILSKYYLLEDRTEHFTRALEWDGPHKVQDALRFLQQRQQGLA